MTVGRIEATILEGQAEVAYLLGPRYWGYGFALEAMRWLHQMLESEFESSNSGQLCHQTTTDLYDCWRALGTERLLQSFGPFDCLLTTMVIESSTIPVGTLSAKSNLSLNADVRACVGCAHERAAG